MNVAKLFKFAFAPDVEVIIARLPERFLCPQRQTPRHSLLERLHLLGQGSAFGFAHQKMDVLRHHYIAVDTQLVCLPDALQRALENPARGSCREFWLPSVATEGEKMKLARLLESVQ